MKQIFALSAAAMLALSTAAVAQNVANQQLTPRIGTQAETVTTILNPATGLLTTTTITATTVVTVVTVVATGVIVSVVVESLTDDDDGNASTTTGATGT